MKIKRVKLQNFKKFSNYSVACRDANILVGPNNSGKSSILDALRVASDVMRHASRRRPHRESFEGHVCASHRLSHSQIRISVEGVSRNYSDEPARIQLMLENGAELTILLHRDESVKTYLRVADRIPDTVKSYLKQFPLEIISVPTLGPLEENELYLADATISKSENTRTQHRHFRNIIYRKNRVEFDRFAREVSSVWPGIELERPTNHGAKNPMNMIFIEDRIPREIHWSGFGFQIWMQMMLQFLRGNENTILVLDEPDIYLHPDLQRQLVRLAKSKFSQMFLATHASEIVNEAESGDILLVSSKKTTGQRINSEKGFSRLFKYLGSSENTEFARLARAKRIVFFEGKDKRILKKFANKIGAGSTLVNPDTVYQQAGGFTQWTRVKEVNWTLSEIFDMDVKIGALFDRDYRCNEEVKEFQSDMNSSGIHCTVLKRKEIENYALEFSALKRIIVKKARQRGTVVTDKRAGEIILELSESQRLHVQSLTISLSTSYIEQIEKAKDSSTIHKEQLIKFENNWADITKRLKMLGGKDFISQLSAYMSREYKCSITVFQIIDEMKSSEVSEDLASYLTNLDRFLA